MRKEDTKAAAARAFVRSLNILLKFARLYEFGHVRTTAQFETTWRELRAALPEGTDAGLLLGASGNQLLLDGVPLGSAAAERSFAQLLSTASIASIHFSSAITQSQFARFVRAFPTGNAKASALAEQLKVALAGDSSIRINEIRFVAEDASVAGVKVAAQLTAKAFGANSEQFKEWFEDPQKLLQLIIAAEGSRGGGKTGGVPGGSGGGGGFGPGGGSGSGGGGPLGGHATGAGPGGSGNLWTGGGLGGGGGAGTNEGGEAGADGAPVGAGSGSAGRWARASALIRGGGGGAAPSGGLGTIGSFLGGGGYAVEEEDVRSLISLFAQLGRSRKDPEARLDPTTFQSRLSALPVRTQHTLQQALAGLAAQAPNDRPDKPMLLKLAEHVAIRFALDSYERGEVKVNAVRQLLDRMNQEIESLRKIVSSHEELMTNAGLQVQSFTELLDQEFWEQVPEENKREVLSSQEAWCVPPRNVRHYLEDLLSRGEIKIVHEILLNYASGIALPDADARRTTAMGLADLAELYGSGDGSVLMEAIRRVGIQLAAERDTELHSLVSAAFVRLSQEAASKRCFAAMQQALASLESVEAQRPGLTQTLRPRIGVEDRMPEFVEETLRCGEIPDGMVDILRLMNGPTVTYITNRYSHCGFREDCEILCEITRELGDEAIVLLRDSLRAGPPSEAVETVGLLSRLDPDLVEQLLPSRLYEWPRTIHDRTVRQISAGDVTQRGRLLIAIFDTLDPIIRSLAIEEIGLSGDANSVPKLVSLLQGENSKLVSPYVRIKAIEALGRLRAHAATAELQQIVDARQVWRWIYPAEMRIAAAQALMRIDPIGSGDRLAGSGLDRSDLTLEPTDPDPTSHCIRQRRYARLKLSRPLTATTQNLRENFKMSIPELNLGGGIAASERHLAPGTLLALKISQGLRTVRAQVIVRGARPQAMGFDIAEMDLEDRFRLRRMLSELGGLPLAGSVSNRSRRRGRAVVSQKV